MNRPLLRPPVFLPPPTDQIVMQLHPPGLQLSVDSLGGSDELVAQLLFSHAFHESRVEPKVGFGASEGSFELFERQL